MGASRGAIEPKVVQRYATAVSKSYISKSLKRFWSKSPCFKKSNGRVLIYISFSPRDLSKNSSKYNFVWYGVVR